MARLPMTLGPLAPEGAYVARSGIRWLCEDGAFCKAGTIVAYCNIGVGLLANPGRPVDGFTDELRDLQAALMLRVDGRVRIVKETSLGGFLDQHQFHRAWEPASVIGEIETGAAVAPGEAVRLLLAAGRRMTEHAEIRSGFLTGWHDRSRAWWADGTRVEGTLLSLGSCETTAAIRGAFSDFRELLHAMPGAGQIVLVPDDMIIPCARTTLEQVRRTPEQSAALAADFAGTFPFTSAPASDWIFAGGVLSALRRSPLTEENSVLARGGVARVAMPDAVIMSLVAEPQRVFRHRKLGYTLGVHDYRIADTGPATRNWIRDNFEPVLRAPDDVRRDYRELIEAVRRRSSMHFLVLNLMSSSGQEDIVNYAQFDLPMARTVGNVYAKEMNLMLHDLAAEQDISIVDNDAIAVELGASRHLPDGVHQSGEMQAEVRREILRILDRRGIPGFAAPRVR